MINALLYNPVTLFYLCWICYVMMIVAKKLRKEKKLSPILWLFFSPFLIGIGVLDVGLQITAAWLLGVPREWTLSKRFERYRTSGKANRWQLFVANKICGHLLNPFEEEHC